MEKEVVESVENPDDEGETDEEELKDDFETERAVFRSAEVEEESEEEEGDKKPVE